jgi:hypothetical protein
MSDLLLIWAGLLAALVLFGVGKPGAGGALVLSYFLGLSLIHVPGALIYLDPHSIAPSRRETELGFTLAVIGMAAFVAGAVIARSSNGNGRQVKTADVVGAFAPHVWPMIVAGFISYVLLMGRASAVPSGTALVSSFGSLIIIGLWLRFYTANLSGSSGLGTLLLLPLLPLTTLSAAGFLGYGVYWALSCLTFLFVIARRRLWFYLGSPIFGVLGLSFFAAYFSLRIILRLVVGTGGSFFDRLTAIWQIFSKFEFLDLSSPLLILAVDQRLNQNYLVGYGAEHYKAGAVHLAYGATVQLWTLVPRAIWPGKPEVGGGGDLVSQFTGIAFAPGTSVGIGQVLEFYMNFAVPGLIIGFFVLGVLLMRIDLGIMRSLRAGDTRGLLLYAMPGLALMQPGGNLVEIIVAAIGAVVASRLLIAAGLFGTVSGGPERQSIAEIAE